MVHAAVGYARHRDRLATYAVHRLRRPRLDQHGHRRRARDHQPHPGAAAPRRHLRDPGRQPGAAGARGPDQPRRQRQRLPSSPVSRFWDRINRPEQLPLSLLAAMRVLTDPAETGAVTLALPQDVQAEAYDWPEELFARRVWHDPPPAGRPAALDRAAAVIRAAERPVIVAGGGVIYSRATDALRAFAERDRHPGRGDPGRQGIAGVRPPASRRRHRRDRHDRRRQPARRRGRRGDRRRHPLQRLHHRVPDRLRRPGRAVRQPQRGVVRRAQAVRGAAARRRARRAGAADATRSPAGPPRRRTTGARDRAGRRSGTPPCSARTTCSTARCRRSPR